MYDDPLYKKILSKFFAQRAYTYFDVLISITFEVNFSGFSNTECK